MCAERGHVCRSAAATTLNHAFPQCGVAPSVLTLPTLPIAQVLLRSPCYSAPITPILF